MKLCGKNILIIDEGVSVLLTVFALFSLGLTFSQ